MQKTKQQIATELIKKGFYDDWGKRNFGPIKFYLGPSIKLEDSYFQKRLDIYLKNAESELSDWVDWADLYK